MAGHQPVQPECQRHGRDRPRATIGGRPPLPSARPSSGSASAAARLLVRPVRSADEGETGHTDDQRPGQAATQLARSADAITSTPTSSEASPATRAMPRGRSAPGRRCWRLPLSRYQQPGQHVGGWPMRPNTVATTNPSAPRWRPGRCVRPARPRPRPPGGPAAAPERPAARRVAAARIAAGRSEPAPARRGPGVPCSADRSLPRPCGRPCGKDRCGKDGAEGPVREGPAPKGPVAPAPAQRPSGPAIMRRRVGPGSVPAAIPPSSRSSPGLGIRDVPDPGQPG